MMAMAKQYIEEDCEVSSRWPHGPAWQVTRQPKQTGWTTDTHRLQNTEPTSISISDPPNLGEIKAIIDEARAMLDWPVGWAEDESPRFLESTWRRAADFVIEGTTKLWETTGRTVSTPQLLPVGDGSIDITWESGARTLVVNVPTDVQQAVSFYGRYCGRRYTIKGAIDTSADNGWLLMWLQA